MKINYQTFNTEIGRIVVAESDAGICCLEFIKDERVADEMMAKKFPADNLCRELTPSLLELSTLLHASQQQESSEERRLRYEAISGLPIDISRATPFQRIVWTALREIPYGQTATYSDIARAIGKPTASRAVGNAIGANQIALLIPCHRIVAAGGGIGGFRWGKVIKRFLLAAENPATPLS